MLTGSVAHDLTLPRCVGAATLTLGLLETRKGRCPERLQNASKPEEDQRRLGSPGVDGAGTEIGR